MKRVLAAGGVFLTLAFLFWLAFVHYTENYQKGIQWNLLTGELSIDAKEGLRVTPPWVLVSRVDTRPVRVCITTAGRAFNCRLIQFVPEAWHEFVAVEGFRYWWWANRISFNFGYTEEYRGMKDLLRGYAYGVKQYSFVKTLKEYQE